jgi:lysozyme family protein
VSDFDRALPIVLRFEGGYVDHPSDPGGETKFGISKRSYPHLDIKALTKEQAGDIYHRDYWTPLKCDALPWPLNLFHFDAGVNHGKVQARKFLNRTPTAQGYLDQRRAFYERLIALKPKMAVFRKGWLRRLDHLATYLT